MKVFGLLIHLVTALIGQFVLRSNLSKLINTATFFWLSSSVPGRGVLLWVPRELFPQVSGLRLQRPQGRHPKTRAKNSHEMEDLPVHTLWQKVSLRDRPQGPLRESPRHEALRRSDRALDFVAGPRQLSITQFFLLSFQTLTIPPWSRTFEPWGEPSICA